MLKRNVNTDLAKTVKTARLQLGLTQQALATRLDVSRQLVYLWEHGLSTPAPNALKALGVTTEYKIKALAKKERIA